MVLFRNPTIMGEWGLLGNLSGDRGSVLTGISDGNGNAS
jgi:hypothetical protein